MYYFTKPEQFVNRSGFFLRKNQKIFKNNELFCISIRIRIQSSKKVHRNWQKIRMKSSLENFLKIF